MYIHKRKKMNRKTIRKYNKKYKTIRRAIRRTRKGGVIFGRQFDPKTEFESLLKKMENLQVFGASTCDESKINDRLSTISRNTEYMVDILREIFKDNGNRDEIDKIVNILMQLGLLYLKTNNENWNFKSDSLSKDIQQQTNMKYACCMNIGKIIGEKIDAENDVMEAKLLQNNEQTKALLTEIEDKQTTKISEASKITNVTEKSSLDAEILRLQGLQVDIVRKKVCIVEIIKHLNKYGFIDTNTLSHYLDKTNGCKDLLQLLLIKPIASQGGSRCRVRNTHRRGKHTRRYKPKK